MIETLTFPASVQAPHAVTDQDKVDRIASSIRENGWLGRQLIITDNAAYGLVAWSGTHRLAALDQVLTSDGGQIDVPVVYVSDADLLPNESADDDDRLAALLDSGETTAAAIMAEEIKHNEMEDHNGCTS